MDLRGPSPKVVTGFWAEFGLYRIKGRVLRVGFERDLGFVKEVFESVVPVLELINELLPGTPAKASSDSLPFPYGAVRGLCGPFRL